MTIDFNSAQRFSFQISPDGLLPKLIEGLLRIDDIFSGPSGFDKKFTVQASDRELAKHLFSDDALQRLCMAFSGLSMRATVDDSGAKAAQDIAVSTLVLRVPYQISSHQGLMQFLGLARQFVYALEDVRIISGEHSSLPKPEEVLALRLDRLSEWLSDLSIHQRAALETQLRWAISKETQICHETLQNAENDSLIATLQARFVDASERTITHESSKGQGQLSGEVQWMKFSTELVSETLRRLKVCDIENLNAAVWMRIEECISGAVQDELAVCMKQVLQTPYERRRDALRSRTRSDLVVCDEYGNFIESRTQTPRWGEWYPGLENSDLSLGEVVSSLPGIPAGDVPEIVRHFENPESANALPGAVTLQQHDFIHVLLGRGLLDQDEAFVIGFTMGSCGSTLSREHEMRMEEAFSKAYPEPYRIVGTKLKAYRLGVQAGRELALVDFSSFDFEAHADRPLAEVRASTLRSVAGLQDFYQREKQMIPDTLESARLPIGKEG
jgi:hypothetical protein